MHAEIRHKKWHLCALSNASHYVAMSPRKSLLLVEDDANEEMIALYAIKKADIGCDVRVARDGVEACHILFESDDPAPSLVLLDVHLPKLNGFEVLQRIRGREETKRLPVVMFSNSGQAEDVSMSCDLHANSYVQKDIDIEAYETRLKLLLYYWFGVHRPAV
jgi:two-component system, response regulator